MKFKFVFCICSFFIFHASLAQLRVGYYHDLDFLPIHDHVHPFHYNPSKKLSFNYNASTFEKGKVYLANGEIAIGYIKYNSDEVWFKAEKSDKKRRSKQRKRWRSL